MKDFVDRQPTKAGRRKLTFDDGEVKYATVEMADDPVVEGTPLNRESFMALQGFADANTTFNEDGSITETNGNGDVLLTEFNDDGSITETFTSTGGLSVKKTTTFNEDGSITVSLVEV